MPQHTPLYIVASQHPRVGKTLVSRLLIEFFRLGGRASLVGYDLDPREPALAPYFPNLVWTVDIADTRGQMALFDRLVSDQWRTTVIDLGYALFEQFFSVMAEIGFEQEARRRGIEPGRAVRDRFRTGDREAAMPSCATACREPRSCRCTTKPPRSCSCQQDFPPSRPRLRRHPHPAAVADRPRRHRPAELLVLQPTWQTSPAARPKSITGSAAFSRNFAISSCGC